MEHTLMFEPSWEKAVSPNDRAMIRSLYEKSSPVPGKVTFTNIRAALNHHGALLAMVLIQNGTDFPFPIEDVRLRYEEEERGTIAEANFNLPRIVVDSHSSMPWTFVFQKQSIQQRPSLRNWKLLIDDYSNNWQK